MNLEILTLSIAYFAITCYFVLLLHEATEDNTKEEIQEEEWANNHKDDEEVGNIRLASPYMDKVYVSNLGCSVHKIRPCSDICNDKKRNHCLVYVIEVVVEFLPLWSWIYAIPLILDGEVWTIVWEYRQNVLFVTDIEAPFKLADSYNSEDHKEEKHYQNDSENIWNRLEDGLDTNT